MTHEAAIAWLAERDVPSMWKDRAHGYSLMVWDKTEGVAPLCHSGAIYIYPDDRIEGNWVLDLMYVPGPSFTTHPTLLEACQAAHDHIITGRADD